MGTVVPVITVSGSPFRVTGKLQVSGWPSQVEGRPDSARQSLDVMIVLLRVGLRSGLRGRGSVRAPPRAPAAKGRRLGRRRPAARLGPRAGSWLTRIRRRLSGPLKAAQDPGPGPARCKALTVRPFSDSVGSDDAAKGARPLPSSVNQLSSAPARPPGRLGCICGLFCGRRGWQLCALRHPTQFGPGPGPPGPAWLNRLRWGPQLSRSLH